MRLRRGNRKRPRGLRVERLEERNLFAGLPTGAMEEDTMELMLGDVAVTVVFFESDGSTDSSFEDWNDPLILETKAKVQEGLDWWVDSLAALTDVHSLNFMVDWTHADDPVDTQYEPINRRSQDYHLWGNEFLDLVGFRTPSPNPSTQIHDDIRAFNHAQRVDKNADWAFTIFVANSEADPDDSWNGAGSIFSRAFAHSGGRVIVAPSGRPASTFAHEIGHQAFALDEYQFGGDYRDRRGYLDIQNINAQNNPNHVHEASIMSNDHWLSTAYNQNISSPSSLEMVGWRDSDGDGVFDPLDVPHKLIGVGRVVDGNYEFDGVAEVQTLLNLNSKKFADNQWVSDITLNEIDRVEYRIDGGQWMNGGGFSGGTATIDLSIPLPDANQHTIEIRTLSIDQITQEIVTSSPVFMGDTSTHEGVASPGLSGFVYLDFDEDEVLEAEDRGLSGWTVQLHDDNGQLLVLDTVAEPDGFNDNTIITTAFAGVTLTAQGTSVSSSNVKALRPGGSTSTGIGVFGSDFSSFTNSIWGQDQFEMRMDFDSPVTRVTLDAVAELDDGYGRLEAYDSSNNLIARYTTDRLADGEVETMMVARSEGDIAYALAFGHADTFVRLDNLQFGAEAETTTNAQGYFEFDYLESGSYYVTPISPSATFENISTGVVHVDYTTNAATAHVDFGFRNTAAWHNAFNPVDINDDGDVNFVDAFVLIEGIRNLGIGLLPDPGPQGPPPFYDFNANNQLDLVDAFAVIDAVRFGGGNDEGEGEGTNDGGRGGQQSGGQAGDGGMAEGESSLDLQPIRPVATRNGAVQPIAWANLSSVMKAPQEAILVAPTTLHSVPDQRDAAANLTNPSQVRDLRQTTARRTDADVINPERNSDSIWAIRDLDQLDRERLESAMAEIADDVDAIWRADDGPEVEFPEESSDSELSLK